MATVLLTPFVENSSAQDAHSALKLAVKTAAQAEHCAVLWFQGIVARKLFKDLGYASIYLYADRELAEGEIGYTKACEIIKVASPGNVVHWMKEARNTPRRELAKKVARAKQNVAAHQNSNPSQGQLLAPEKTNVPKAAAKHKVHLEMSTQQHARYESLREKLHKLGGVPSGSSTVELLLAGLASLVESGGNQEHQLTSPTQIHVHKCPECEKSTITTSGGDTQLTEKEFERLSCDAQVQTPGKPNRATIKPSIKRQVLSRDQHRCQAPGCRNTWFLEVHHIKPRRLGGTNDLNNLTTLCGACHSYLHEKSGRNFRPPHGKIDGPDEAVSF